MSTQEPSQLQHPVGLTSLPRLEDLPIAEQGFDQQRVRARTAVRHDRIVENFDAAGLRIDRDDRRMRGIGKDAGIVRLVAGGCRQTRRVDPVRQLLGMVIPGAADGCEFDASAWSDHAAVANLDVRLLALQKVRADFCDGRFEGAARVRNGAAGGDHGARGVGAGSGRRG